MKTKLLRNCILALSVIFILLGVYSGEPEVIYSKAIRICLECIGIG